MGLSGKKFRELKREVEYKLQGRTVKRDEEGNVIINMTVKNDEGFLSPFSENNSYVISEEVADFIENSTKEALPKDRYTLYIYSNCIDEEEKEVYKKAINEYYTKEYIAIKREIKRSRMAVLIMGLIGVMFLALALALDYNGFAIWTEVVDIAAWVFLWEAVYLEFFDIKKAKMKMRYYLSYLSMKIVYLNDEK
ncbi:MAG: hypothetical protein E7675_06155 [Ruminococcaceae bacterium]|nr:hypothetical protein [Oscillospiraceae bacterium]